MNIDIIKSRIENLTKEGEAISNQIITVQNTEAQLRTRLVQIQGGINELKKLEMEMESDNDTECKDVKESSNS